MFGIGRQKLPADFHVIIDDHAAPVKLLLFVRHAWSLEEGSEPLPPLAPVPGIGSSALPAAVSREIWLQRWNHEWRRMRDWYALRDGQPRDLSQADMQRLSRPGQELDSQLPPFWSTEHGTEGLDMDAFQTWDSLTLNFWPRRESRRNMKALRTPGIAA